MRNYQGAVNGVGEKCSDAGYICETRSQQHFRWIACYMWETKKSRIPTKFLNWADGASISRARIVYYFFFMCTNGTFSSVCNQQMLMTDELILYALSYYFHTDSHRCLWLYCLIPLEIFKIIWKVERKNKCLFILRFWLLLKFSGLNCSILEGSMI